MSKLRYAASDTVVLARRSLLRIPRQPDLLVGFTVQPVMFVLLFVYVFGGAITTPGLDYVDFLIPGIIVQSMVFGGFVTALGLAEDLKKGLMDRFRSLPMWGPAVLAGRILADVGTNMIQLVVMFTVGIAVGFRFSTGAPEVIAGIALLLLFGYAFSWVFAFIGLTASSPEAANAYGFTILFPFHVRFLGLRPRGDDAGLARAHCGEQPIHDHGRCCARPVCGDSRGQRRLGVDRLGDRDHGSVRVALDLALPPCRDRLTAARGPCAKRLRASRQAPPRSTRSPRAGGWCRPPASLQKARAGSRGP